ncbi:MAG TPA: nucleoside 2-deoxyribosyltransferase domain-containing protein [Chitinophagaceae bacterium]
MIIYKAPQEIGNTEGKKIFLGGTIDNGASVNWQETTIQFFKEKNCTILNPRRDDWDQTWKQEASDFQFSQQVNWEMEAMDGADIIILNFLAGSQSPISLLELGLQAKSGKLVVCCPKEYWRSGNVHLLCTNYHIPLYNNMRTLLESINL